MPQRFAEGFDPNAVKAMMAARTGERDPDKLCAMALRSLAR
jgi:hypothetical protein